jgi:hypothetical protein
MDGADGKKWGDLSVIAGGRAREHRTHAELELDRAMRALINAMRSRSGAAVNKNFRNVARAHTRPWYGLVRRWREAKRARNDAHNYPLAKASVRELDHYVDMLFGRTTIVEDVRATGGPHGAAHDSGEFRPAA